MLGRSPSHRRALLRNLAVSLILTERDAELDANKPKTKGRIVTTLEKAKEAQPLIERCVTIARRSLPALEEAEQFASDAERHHTDWRAWRSSERYRKWNEAMAPVVAARRRVLKLLGARNKPHQNGKVVTAKEAVEILFNDIAPRFADRPGGYTRVVRLATPRLGDAGTRAILEFVGVRDRVVRRSEAPKFSEPPAAREKPKQTATAGAEASQDPGEEQDKKSDD